MVHYSDEYLLEQLRECKDRHGKISTQVLNKDDDLPSGPTYGYRFESLKEAVKKAGLDEEYKLMSEGRGRNQPDEEIVKERVKEIAVDGEVCPSVIEEDQEITTSNVLSIVESSTLVGETITGIDIVSTHKFTAPSKDEIDDIITKVDEKNDTFTKSKVYDTELTEKKLLYHYDSFEEAVEENDVEYNADYNHGIIRKTVENINQPHDYVYTIRKNGELYVGKSVKPIKRIYQHSQESKNEITLEQIERVPEERNVDDYEREVAMRTAREYNTTDITGGK